MAATEDGAPVEWCKLRGADRPSGELAMNAYLAAPDPQPTYVAKLDQLLGGGMSRGLFVLGGPPSCGKSVLACQAAALMCDRGRRVMYASYEMSWEVVQLRCASAWSCQYHVQQRYGVRPFSWADVFNGSERRRHPEYAGLSRGELGQYLIREHMDPVAYALTRWDEGPGRNLAVMCGGYDVHELCDVASSVEGEPPILIVDYLQIVPSGAAQEQSEYQRVTEVVNALQAHAYSGNGGHVMALSSTRNLTAADYKDGPSLSWYRGSGYVGFAAEQAAMIVTDRRKDDESGQYVPSLSQDGRTEGHMTMVKNKSGASGQSIATLMAGWCNLIE